MISNNVVMVGLTQKVIWGQKLAMGDTWGKSVAAEGPGKALGRSVLGLFQDQWEGHSVVADQIMDVWGAHHVGLPGGPL